MLVVTGTGDTDEVSEERMVKIAVVSESWTGL